MCQYIAGVVPKSRVSAAFGVGKFSYVAASTLTENPRVGGSIPPLGTIPFHRRIPQIDNFTCNYNILLHRTSSRPLIPNGVFAGIRIPWHPKQSPP